MKIKVNVYTSCYSKMLNRHKNQNDFYIQVSRSLFYSKKTIDGKSIMSMIDLNYGGSLGMYEQTLQEYEERIRSKDFEKGLQDLAEIFTPDFILKEMTEEDEKEIETTLKEIETDLKSPQSEIKANIANYNNWTQEEKEDLYMFGFTEKKIKNINDWKPCVTFNFFLLCFEDLDTKYTEKDEKKWADCKTDTFKTCHRTILAKVLNERYNLGITEL